MPRVSIVLPTYNGERYLRESIDSCLQQSFSDFELIVVVDGSTDGTTALLGNYADPRLKIVSRENRGLPTSLNDGFSQAQGELWTWTSDDNAYLPDALRAMVDHLDAHPASPMVFTDCVLIDDSGRTTGYSDDIWACFLYRRDAALRTGPYRPEFRLVEDVDFFLRLMHTAGPFAHLALPHYRYRVHQGSLSTQQLAQRHLMSLKMHYDLVTRGIENLDLLALFLDRLSKTAMHRDRSGMQLVLDFAREKQVPFLRTIERRARLYRTPPGWLYNRVQVAVQSRWSRLRRRILRAGARP